MVSQGLEGIANYRFVSSLGSGALGHTYLAERDGSQFVVKLLHILPSEDAIASFRHDISQVGRDHPNLARYVAAGTALFGGRHVAYVAADYEPGCTLDELLAQEDRANVADLAEIATDIAFGLEHLHANGVVHRNVKPSNICISAERGTALLLDFGIADLLDEARDPSVGVFVGDISYAAPEALAGLPAPSTDIYALGAVLYRALAGRPPLVAENHAELVARILEEDPEPPFAFNESIPHWIESAILFSLSKDAVARPRSAAALARTLRGDNGTRPSPTPEPHNRDKAPLLAARAASGKEARAIVDAVMAETGPDIAVAPVSEAQALRELPSALQYDKRLQVAVDTRIPDLEHPGFRLRRGQQERAYLPLDGAPYTPESLRSTEALTALAQADFVEQRNEGATVLRSPAFPVVSTSSDWVPRNTRLARFMKDVAEGGQTLNVYGMTRVAFAAIAHPADRRLLANRMAWSMPQGHWLEVPKLANATPDILVACLEFALLLQESGARTVWRVPDFAGEFAWSMGVAGIEVRLGAVGDFRFPEALPASGSGGQQSRFSFRSMMASLPRDAAVRLLRSGFVEESTCACPACVHASTPEQQVRSAAQHNLETWAILAGDLQGLTAEDRRDRFEERIAEARAVGERACSELDEKERAAIQQQTRVVAGAFDLAEERGTVHTVSRTRTRSR